MTFAECARGPSVKKNGNLLECGDFYLHYVGGSVSSQCWIPLWHSRMWVGSGAKSPATPDSFTFQNVSGIPGRASIDSLDGAGRLRLSNAYRADATRSLDAPAPLQGRLEANPGSCQQTLSLLRSELFSTPLCSLRTVRARIREVPGMGSADPTPDVYRARSNDLAARRSLAQCRPARFHHLPPASTPLLIRLLFYCHDLRAFVRRLGRYVLSSPAR